MRKQLPSFLRAALVTAAFIAGAFALRAWPLSNTGTRFPWLTFYPAVMAVAVFEGVWAGIIGALLSAAVVWFIWPVTLGAGPIKDTADVVGMTVFLLNCALISLIAESMRTARAKARLAQEQAEKANRAKSVFLASMSHELRTPLNAILGFSRLMQNDASIAPEHRQTLGVINRSGEHLLSLINNVLDMAKIESGRTLLEKTTFDLRVLLQDVAELMRQRAEAKELQLMLQVTEPLPCAIVADETKLRQILLNLLGNAIKFTRQGSVALRVSAHPANGTNQATLLIEVADTGVGIALEDQQRVFEPFVQLGNQSGQKGSGLGLTITRQFVELMSGSIRVESVSGQGSAFRVQLPLEAAASAPAAVVRGPQVARLMPGQPEHRILIVEDNEENWRLLSQILSQAGFQVRVAENGAKGVEAFQTWRPHLIWMDWRMPVMDGLEATRCIRTLAGGRDVKIVVLSASVLKENREHVLAAGADGLVNKPIRFDEIYACLTKHLGVEFAVEEVAIAPPARLDTAALAALPEILRKELADALVSLDASRIAETIRRVSGVDSTLGAALENHAARLQYTVIQRALPSTFAQCETNKT